MEQVFSISELCALICIHCDVGTCACLARTAKIFLAPSLDRIWEHPTKRFSAPLFHTILSTSWTPKSYDFEPGGTLNREDYDTLQSFSKRVRTLWMPALITSVLPPSFVHDLLCMVRRGTAPPLFEKLQTLAFEVELGAKPPYSEMVLETIFLYSSIQILHLSFIPPNVLGSDRHNKLSAPSYPRLIELLDARCPSLRSLTIWKMSPGDCDTLLSIIARSNHLAKSLQHISILGYPRESLQDLPRMKNIFSLEFGGSIVAYDEPKLPTWQIRPQEEAPVGLQSLRYHFRTPDDVDLFKAPFISQPRSLRFLEVVLDVAFEGSTVRRIFRRAGKHSNLTTFTLKALRVSILPRSDTIGVADLRILGRASNLQMLHLEVCSRFWDEDLAECIPFWPMLTELVLVQASKRLPDSDSPTLTLDSLITISEGCKNLRLLKLSINFSDVSQDISISSVNSTSMTLICVESVIPRLDDELETLFRHLTAIFPNIIDFTKDVMYAMDVEVESAWSKLQRMVAESGAKEGTRFKAIS
ncbi:hypothetical protein DL96DRAFT_1706490 [Flagelloscypha sp. PMI_526]|nr:hypothetical protein DL96DRAFT_1706490 [Flagelloscypha sp. PMI_526]